jgi:hypothetical protein
MAKYNLYCRDKTYIAIVQYGASLNPPKTFGKLANEILDRWANGIGGETPPQLVCVVCGSKATLQVFGKGQQKFYVCCNHKKIAQKTGAFKQLE